MWQGSVVGSVRCASYGRIYIRHVLKATAAEPAWGGLVSEGVVRVKNTLYDPIQTSENLETKQYARARTQVASWRPTGAPIRCSSLSKSRKAKTNS